MAYPNGGAAKGGQVVERICKLDSCSKHSQPLSLIHLQVLEKLYAIGVAKHSPADIQKISEDNLLSLSAYLGAKHFFTGFKPTRLDAITFANLALILYLPFDTPQKCFIHEKCPNLREFCERIKRRYWPDWEECTKGYKMNSEWKGKVASGHS